MNTKLTQGEWKVWWTGCTAAPYVAYVGENAPTLTPKGHLSMNGSELIAEVSSQRMRLDERENIVDEGAANARLIVGAPALLLAALETKKWLVVLDGADDTVNAHDALTRLTEECLPQLSQALSAIGVVIP